MKNLVQKVIAGGVIFYKGKVLIIKRASDEDVLPDLWELPSGKKEPLENITDTCKREVKEETGIDVEIIKLLNAFNFVVEKPDETRDVTEIDFLTKPAGPAEVKLSSEHQAFAWITEQEIDNYDISKETKEVIRLAFKQ